MDNREAIQLLDELLLRSDFSDQYGDMEDSSPYEEAVEIAREAIEKQIPKKVKIQFCGMGFKTDVCPTCGDDFYIDDLGQTMYYSFCPDCGQALDWSSEK